MPSKPPKAAVTFTPEFKRNLRALAKKYHHIRTDVGPFIDNLQTAEFKGDRLSGAQHVIYKARIKNSDIQKGKSAGYRIIYLVKSPGNIVLLTIYSKLDQSDISADQIRRILKKYF